MELDTKYYYAFVLGYDFFNEELKNSPSPECDLNYEFCCKIAEDFLNSSYFKNTIRSGYEMFEEYINDNKFKILKNYEKYIGVENIYFKNNKKILEIGNRGEQPVALLEWCKSGKKEYVVAIDYTIDNDRIYWSRGYYYDNCDKAKIDFDRVKNGEYLTHHANERDR